MRTISSVARFFFLLPAIVLATSGCGGDGGNGLTNPPSNGSSGIDVTGNWFFIGSLIGPSILCNVGGFVQLNQSGSNISGTYTDVGADCVLNTTTLFVLNWGNGPITNGSLSGNTVTFDFGPDWSNTSGPIFAQAPSALFGTSSATVDFGGSTGQVTLNGSWEAAR